MALLVGDQDSLADGYPDDVLIISGGGNHTLLGMSGNDYLQGGDGDDVFDADVGTYTNAAAGIDIMVGGLGDDTYTVDNASDQVVEFAGEGTDTILASVSYTLAPSVENLTLVNSAANGTGNALVNTIIGTGMTNTLNGGAGADTLDGGLGGSDTFVVDDSGDTVIGVSGLSTDVTTIISSVTYELQGALAAQQNNINVSNITLTGTSAINAVGNGKDNIIVGNAAVNTLDGGGAGDDTLDGGGGADTMIGGIGDDTYVIDNAGDVIVEAVAAESDSIRSSITIDMNRANYANVENVLLTGSANLNAIANNATGNAITGNSGRNTITGGNAGDILSGGVNSGTQGDRLVGGGGDDQYIIFNANDVVIEAVGGGRDQVAVFTTFSLSGPSMAGQEIENLVLLGTGNINGTGNALENTIIGNSGNNIIDAGLNSVAGVYDTLVGGDGDDTYIVRNEGLLPGEGDFIDEILDQGIDTVQAAFSYTLTTFVENLVLTGTANINGTGNGFINTITGNAGQNTIDGGVGADTMIGGAGNDTYIVDEIGDVVIENAGIDVDTVRSIVSYTAGANIENVTLQGGLSIDATGNSLGNILTGNAADNTLDGMGGADRMIGGLGNDYYFVDVAGDSITELAGEGTDTVEAASTYSLAAASAVGIENLVITGTGNFNGTGNAIDNVITGNIGNNTLDGAVGNDTLIGGAGDDYYVVDATLDIVSENASEGTDSVSSSATFTLAANVENLVLTGGTAIDGTGNASDNTITGNSGVNVLTGLGGNDTLSGLAGADTMIGGLGDDYYVVDNIGDVVSENVGEGTDTVSSNATFTLSGNIENLVLTGTANINGTGDAGDNVITGNSGINTLTGNDGNDTLDGGLGADIMIGGIGNDTYIVNVSGDVVSENAVGGIDTIITNATYVLGGNIENLILSGTAAINGTGDAGVNVITGNSAVNMLSGLGGDDTLDGGAGADNMNGGLGNDLFIVDNIGDKVTEGTAGGTDTVRSSVSFTLAANVENLTLTGTANINATGNADANILFGNSGNNTLNGGAGADFMNGGAGNDVYILDNLLDIVADSSGIDTIQVNFNADLNNVAYTDIENIILTGTTAINATGNASANTLTGNSGVNTLTGGDGDDVYYASSNDVIVELATGGNDTLYVTITGTFVIPAFVENVIFGGTGGGNATGNNDVNTFVGGAGNNTLDGGGGADVLSGGKGSDVYIADNTGDIVIEGIGEGTDTVRATASYTLSANVENLVLLGTGSIDGTGNNLNNTITGNTGNNTLDGGTGTDRLIGGAGNDTYIIDNIRDVIVDASGNDTVMTGITYTLQAGLENLTLTGTSDVNGTGNTLVNILTGNSGANTLDGGAANDTLFGGDGNDVLKGGTGADVMNGGDGNDTYTVDNINDLIIDVTGEGTDSLTTTVNYTLSSTAEIEVITLGGTTALNFTGSDSDNTITGNAAVNSIDGGGGNDILSGLAGNDILSGGLGDDILTGGAGADRMTGGGGADTFIFESASALLNVDTITDFNVVTDNDVLDLSDVLTGVYDPLTDVLSDYVRILDSGANSIVQIDIDGFGVGTAAWKTVAILQGINGLTGAQALVDSGNLIVS